MEKKKPKPEALKPTVITLNLELPDELPEQLVNDFRQIEDLETMTFTEGWQVLMNDFKDIRDEIQQQIDGNDPNNSDQVKYHVKGCKLLVEHKKFLTMLMLPITSLIANIRDQLNHNDLFTGEFPYAVGYDYEKNIIVIEDAKPETEK